MAKNKYEEAYSKSFKGLGKQSEAIMQRTNKYADFMGNAAALPYQLKDEFKQREDPALNTKIAQSEQAALGGAIEGLSKYQGITNPFDRRALAEKYQSGLSVGTQSLYSERDRRQGTLLDYIDKWTGLFGAEAKKEELILNAMKEDYANKYQMGQSRYGAITGGLAADESSRQFNETMALDREKFNFQKSQAGSGKGGTKADSQYLSYALDQLTASKGMNKGEYHSDTYKELLAKAPNDATRSMIKELYTGGSNEPTYNSSDYDVDPSGKYIINKRTGKKTLITE